MFELDDRTKSATVQALNCFLSTNYLRFDEEELTDIDSEVLEYLANQCLEKFTFLIQSDQDILQNIVYWFQNKPMKDIALKMAEKYYL
jgi:hypothetical protein